MENLVMQRIESTNLSQNNITVSSWLKKMMQFI